MKELGIFIIKPDGIYLGEEEVAKDLIKSSDLEIKARQDITFSKEQVDEFYADKVDGLSQYFGDYLIPRPSVLLIAEGENTNNKLNKIKRQMRKDFSHDNFYTGTHCSDNEIEARSELKILKVNYETK